MKSRTGAALLVTVAVLQTSCTSAPSAGATTSLQSTSSTNVESAGTTSSTTIGSSTTLAPSTSTSEAAPSSSQDGAGEIEIVQEMFSLGGETSNAGSPAQGLLMNSRMVQAVIDVEGENSQFAYPDTGVWDPERNTSELIAALPAYASYGLNAITVNLQGGNPLDAPVQNRPAWRISAYGADGSLDPDWMARLERVLVAADSEGMAVIVGLFYFGQDHHLADETAVTNAVDNVVDWLVERDHRNVLIEICNECNTQYDHEILKPPRVTELVDRVTSRSEGRLPVSASLTGGKLPGASLIEASSYILLHGNRQNAEQVAAMVRELRSRPRFQDQPKPIVFNEDSTQIDNLRAAVSEGAGWGYHDKGTNDYHNGFQAPPVDWSVGTADKQAFFDEVARLTSP